MTLVRLQSWGFGADMVSPCVGEFRQHAELGYQTRKTGIQTTNANNGVAGKIGFANRQLALAA